MQTPDEVLRDLDALGEEKVREKLEDGHFASYKMPLIEGWLERKEQGREAVRQAQEERHTTREKDRVTEALGAARVANESSDKANRMSLAAIVVAAVSLVLSTAALVVLAVR